MDAGEWNGDTYMAHDGRQFAIFSELVRGEPRFYWVGERVADGTGERGEGPGSTNWRRSHLPDGSYDKRTMRRRVERYVTDHPTTDVT